LNIAEDLSKYVACKKLIQLIARRPFGTSSADHISEVSMYKNLNCEALGISGRQSEIIELALTYRFSGFEIDMAQFAKQAELRGLEHARRFIDSAEIKIGGFALPVRWQGEEAIYRENLERLPKLAEVAASIGATGCRTVVMPTCDDRPYHENFEFHRQRLTEIADLLASHQIRLGLDFVAPAYHREDRQFQFISSAETLILLMKTIGVPNVGVVVDLWSWHVGGGSLDLMKELSADQIVSVRLADVPEDAELESIREDQRLLPGSSGVIDAEAALRRLAELEYSGPITPFPSPSQFGNTTRDRIVKMASDSIEDPWKALGLSKDGKLPVATG